MDSTRAYKFRLFPDKKRREAINYSILLSQRLYNKLLERTIEAHKENPSSKISQRTINQFLNEIIKEDKIYLQLYAHVRVDIRNRLLKTYQNFFRRCKAKKSGAKIKAGFPRFRSRDRYKSITHIEDNGSFQLEKEKKKDYLRVSKIGRMQIEIHRKIEGKIKTMTIKREAGKYYAIFTTIREINPPEVKKNTNPVGMDMGLNNFVALSDGTTIKKPKFLNQRKPKIAKWQRIVARRHKGSHRRESAKLHLQREWEDVTNQSNDFAHKLSDRLVKSGYTSFIVEALAIQNMVKNHNLAQSIHNASWNRFIQLLSYKAESAGMKVIKVDAGNTTQQCSNCGNIREGANRVVLGMETYICNRCGLRIDRDVNASINILKRATEGHSGSHAQGENARPQQEAVLEELRTYSATKNGIQVVGEANDL